MRKCFCNENFKWDGSSLNCTQEYGNLAKTPKPANQKPLLSYLAIVVGIPIAVALVALVCIIGYMTYLCKKAITNRKENRTTPAVHLYDSERGAKHLTDSEQFREEDKKGIDVSFFHLEDILAATNNFLDANKLEQGGFGPIYKGKFPEAQEVVVKRLSRASGQGPKEFKNEVLIAKLQHQNMFRLLAIVLKEIRRSYSMNICPTKT